MKVKLTITNRAGKTASKTVDPADIKPTERGLRKFGMDLAYGISTLRPLGYSVNYELQQGTSKYAKPLFTISNFLSKLMKAIDADKKCECGRLILCTCHEKCELCEPCTAGTKTASVAIDLGERIYTAASRLNLAYDDAGENAARDKEDND